MAEEDGREGGAVVEGGDAGGSGPGGEPGDQSGDVPGGESGDTGTSGLRPDVLPDFLRGRSEQEIKFYLNQAFTSVESQQEQIRQLRQELEQAKTTPTAPEREPDPDDERPLEELMLENPDKALERWARDRGLLDRFDELDSRMGRVAFRLVEDEFPGAKKYRSEIQDILQKANSPINEATITMAFKMLKGEEALEEQKKQVRKQMNNDPPKAPDDSGPKTPQMTDLERTFAKAQGLTDEEFVKYRDEELSVRLPTD